MSTSSLLTFVALSLGFGLAFFLLGYVVRKKVGERRIRNAEIRAEEIIVASEREAERQRLEQSKEGDRYLLRLKKEFDEKQESRKYELDDLDSRVRERERHLDDKFGLIQTREKEVQKDEDTLREEKEHYDKRKGQLEGLISEENERLQRVSGMGQEDAKRQLMKRMETEVRVESSRMIKSVEEEARQIADKKAKNILALAMQRCAAEFTMDSTVSVIQLPSEEMKGRIIGKEGRNIRAFEQATGVDVVIDDTPGAVVLSAFDPVRREVAREASARLIEDGRIHPSSIEETVGKVRQQMDEAIRQEGENALLELGLGDMHPELIHHLGRLKYRTSYGQNSLAHAKEVAALMNSIASEMGLDPLVAKRAGLLHDIGKAVTHEVEGPHALIGGDLARRFGESPEVIHAIEAHHEDIEPKSSLPILVQAADAMSGSRLGARRESLDHYVRRLERLEKLALTIPGVERVFAIQAGREVRVLVNPNEVQDNQMPALAREITKSVEENMNFPGQIRVTVIRETRTTEFAKSK